MSWGAIEWARTWNGDLTSNEAFVLFLIAHHFNEKDLRSWPSATVLVESTRLSRRSVFRAIAELKTRGLITVEPWQTYTGKTLTNRYCLPLYNTNSTPVDNRAENVDEQQSGVSH